MFDAFPSFKQVFDTFEDPQRLHAIVVHLPIALTLLGFILTLGVALTGSRASGLRWTTVFIFLLATLSAGAANYTGEESELNLLVKPTGNAAELLEKHKELGEFFWIGLAVTGTLILLSSVRVTWFRSITLVLALLTSIASVIWMGAIGHYGGEMVYRESVGVPSAGPIKAPTTNGTNGVNGAKKDNDKDDTKIEPDKDKKLEPVKDGETTKDKADEKDSGERKLPEVEKKDKTIFDP